jgi:hypothetical protein
MTNTLTHVFRAIMNIGARMVPSIEARQRVATGSYLNCKCRQYLNMLSDNSDSDMWDPIKTMFSMWL